MTAYAAVVLAGGAARRMGGRDKPAVPVAGRPMRDRVLAAVADASPRVLVGPAGPVSADVPDARGPAHAPAGPAHAPAGPAHAPAGPASAGVPARQAGSIPADVLVTREEPPGGGPVAAAAAGLALLPPGTTTVALLAADLPLLTRDAVTTLLDALTSTPPAAIPPDAAQADTARADAVRADAVRADAVRADAARADAVRADAARSDAGAVDGACLLDGDGRRQPLCGVWRVAPLRAALDRVARRRGGTLDGASVRELLAELTVREVAWPGDGPPPWFDCDTDSDVRRAEEWAR